MFGRDGPERGVKRVLERVEGVTRLTGFTNFATRTMRPGATHGKSRQLVGAAERACVVNDSLLGVRALRPDVTRLQNVG